MTETVHGYRLSRQQSWWWPAHAAGWPLAARCDITLRGPVDGDRLTAVANRVLRRHEALRTTFPVVPGLAEPVQRVAADPATAGVRAELTGPGDDGSRTLVLHASAMVVDTAGLAGLFREIAAGYAAEDAAEQSPPEETQYAAYSEWQHDPPGTPEEAAAADRGAAYWQARLSETAATEVPYAVGRPAPPPAHDRVPVHLDDDLVAAVRRHASDVGAGVDSVLLAAWTGLLGVLTGHRRVTVGAAVDGRSFPELAGVAGPFTRFAPVTVTLPAAGAARELTAEVAGVLAANREHQDQLPAGASLTGGGAPTFPIGFEWVVRPAPVEAGGVAFAVAELTSASAPTELCLEVTDGDPGLQARLSYHPGRLTAEAAWALAEQFPAALSHVVADRGARPVRSMDLYTAAAAATVDAANATDTGEPAPSWLRTVAERAAATPDAVAVSDAGAELTYAELDRRAGRLAGILRHRGIGPEDLVAVCHRPSAAALVAALGILRAGGVWLPLDPAWPIARLRMIMRDARPGLLLTESALMAAADGVTGDVLCLDECPELLHGTAEAPAAVPEPAALAYVLYTSGSTGTPKGVAVTHGGLDNYLAWARDAYAMSPATRSLVHTSLSFDLTLTTLFAPLLAGGRVHFAEPAGFEGLVRDLSVGTATDLLKLTPAHLRLLRQTGVDPERLSGLRTLVIGGEALGGDVLEPWRRIAPDATFVNEYGPTETVVGCSAYRVAPGRSLPGHPAVPIGTPVANTRLLVLDRGMRRVGIGVPGELYIAGAGIARGYRGRPGLTAERFVPNPYGAAGERLYRTGDLARHLPGGELEFLGRNDEQLQLNGFRVEPAEVEAVLARHPDVAAAAVTAHTSGDAGALIGYVTAAPGARPDASEVREFVRTRLPAHLVPSGVVVLAELPLTGNGKVDRDRLPAPATAPSGEPEPGGTPTEEAIAAIWAQALGVDRVGVHENFFDLGGHSFLLVELAAQLKRRFGADVTVLTLLEHPTVAGLAAALGGQTGHTGDEPGADDAAGGDAVHRRAHLRRQAQQRHRDRHEASR
ncbi:non-ribosomal peptide synthetase [Jidongwangia harbinensis]|uniref:non-ribosomal peptide synthetase n=1 Tax=Jidongwangia harbinensis TaxID=2878561 RepID=UPI001CDA177B|nr:non-ribosomal peptide synthetase [Jidongwangia harbinensis]MCA2219344.1 amino acid adenylation domain-containing protein [Jidongwangia harbinensis]